ncbi:tRNA 2-thiocytidine biosynthesis protein TtcA [Parabacteroides sp. PF5-5]|uniref:ATP-binding protein n=1 Tax=unclassified Parabacteroides TaxID=2649774 RepID=UPI002476D8F0|nr:MULTISPECIES: ATP-binding protein [unclassified Parabacteroides]MDH6305860.1 tRNA 2-thiocytidine biosynthesis protein TtcA [Parabacteroides sp. PH5-39]MDH6317326.1 tRNA 2-thiocytidine biosynthesis protein TtcA [Parabacteroides sp. PF5-13]MDH6320534.1 tRNA 2-thiocytidine biosynthesis protein TtcA [Parabacteroides sp. PH5-13]MDH6324303.1 tRNA 2-thiocytidine biosynthesis protein TtcA [Parabacteroides sp. PH5-8]MDH6328500.1 tRNA 2-thiocytidine biosynthesis protein TtcA [Parabacteroides sp. PH5-
MAAVSEDEKRYRKIKDKVRKAILDYGLIKDGDRILIGLSGGKDSLALLDLLGDRSRIFQPRFELVAAHIVMTNIPYHSDQAYLRDFAARYDIPFVLHETSFDASTDTRKSPCFLCSWTRRKALFEIAKANSCNKIALGHHQDDILETLLMNLTHQGAFSTMPPKLKMDKFEMEIIRPLCLVPEKELIWLAAWQEYKKQVKNCPYESGSNRSDMKRILQQLEDINPEARYSLWGSMTNIQEQYLPQKIKPKK